MKLKSTVLLFGGLLFGSFNSIGQTQVFNYTGTIDTYTVPAGVTMITIVAEGAQGGNSGGLGAVIQGDISVTPGDQLSVLVGGAGSFSTTVKAGGGGGSFVVDAANTPFVIAGGGGGKAWDGSGTPTFPRIDASITESGNDGYSELNTQSGSFFKYGVGGINGNGATLNGPDGAPHAGNGGGFFTDGGTGACGGPGLAFVNGGAGGTGCSGGPGGFGGGGDGGNAGGGGGGGYSGGGGSYHHPTNGGGGGSYNVGINQSASVGRVGDGMITITVVLCDGLTTTASALTLCSADMLTLTATSSNGGNITWDNGVVDGVAFQPNMVGTVNYTAISDHADDCDFTYSITLLESPEFNLTPTSEFVNGDGGISLTLVSGLFPFTYDWDNDGIGDFDDTQNLDLVPAGTYSVTVAHSNGCTRTKTATITSQVSIEDNEIELFSVFPNPTNRTTMIEYSGNFNYEIVNVIGEVLMSGIAKDKTLVDLTELTNGNYFVRINSNNSILTKKIVKM